MSAVSQFMQDSRLTHWQVVVRILRYLKSSPHAGLFYKKHEKIPDVHHYVDSDWVGSSYDRQSTSGYCITLGGNLTMWKSKKQIVVARTSAGAVYQAVVKAL